MQTEAYINQRKRKQSRFDDTPSPAMRLINKIRRYKEEQEATRAKEEAHKDKGGSKEQPVTLSD